MPKTLYEKIWDAHVVKTYENDQSLIYIDRHLVQEVSSPQAFEGLRKRGINVRRPLAQIAVADHAIPTKNRDKPIRDGLARKQVAKLIENTKEFGVPYIPVDDPRHGIVHVIGPELGFTLPGTTLVCGDSHTSTHGAFGALAFGIGSSQCETVLAVQALKQTRQKTMRITINGELQPGVSIKDVILAIIRVIGVNGAQDHAIEYVGSCVSALSMEARMTLCNMSIEAGARIALIAPDAKTYEYLASRPLAPKGALLDQARSHWETLYSDDGAHFDQTFELDASIIVPQVSWGTNPADTSSIDEIVPNPDDEPDLVKRARLKDSLDYMGLRPGRQLAGTPIDKVFIGSCTNSRIEDLQKSAKVIAGRKVAKSVSAIVVPGSAAVQIEAEALGLDRVFKDAGFEWRDAGCSMCVAMNDDRLAQGERCASTSNRNFRGRQGPGGRTHLMSPEMAAAAAITGQICDVRKLIGDGYA